VNNPQFQLGVCNQRVVNPVRIALKFACFPQLKLGVIHGLPLQGCCYYLQQRNTQDTDKKKLFFELPLIRKNCYYSRIGGDCRNIKREQFI
jgi:hypothetical protein